MSYTPEQIASREFAMAAEGYDPVEVRAYLRDLAERFPASTDFASVGEEITLLLRTAHEAVQSVRDRTTVEATEITATAARTAAEVLSRAESDAADLQAVAASDLAEAERIEATSRATADAVVAAAEADAQDLVQRTEDLAQRRLADVEDRLGEELDRLVKSERDITDCLLAARGALASALGELRDFASPTLHRGE
ncbi:MAG: DivIVA domain-containing protein [Acidimicrobiia bacterium]|nr:DivIVA domain-containing protein [Acidimicrobiia bacterium]